MTKNRSLLISAIFVGFLGLKARAAEQARPPFAVPPRFGVISDYWQPGDAEHPVRLNRDQVVVLIQDLHANVGVQKNIASILYRLRQLNTTRTLLVCVEGASGEGDVSLLRSLPGPVRHAFEEMLLHRAYLTGAELAATESAADIYQHGAVIWNWFTSFFAKSPLPAPVTLSPIHLWGVDDPDLYRKNWHAAKQVDKMSQQALTYVRPTKSLLMEGAAQPLKKQLDLLTKLLMLRLQPDEYKEYLQGRHLNPKGPAAYEETVKAAEDYYKAADLRSSAMAKNLLDKMGKYPGVTGLVTGGFHTREIAQILKQKKIAYAVVTPDVKVLDQDQAYKARLREEE
jgi:hypothetical protein